MKKIANEPMLITYANSLGGNLAALESVLDDQFAGAFGGVHILPFFPSSGDRGFAVIDYDTVDPTFGDWDDIRRLADSYYLMADFMINHVSIRSREFVDYMQQGDASQYREMFIHWDEFWPGGEPTEEQMAALYRRKAHGPFKEFTRADGTVVKLWNTFFEEQVDIDPWAPQTQAYFERNLGRLAELVPLIRFDAFAYASKRQGTSCFFVEPEVWDVLEIGMKPLESRGVEMLPEIHENYQIQLKMADRGHWVYDFALPMLMLHTVFSADTTRLIEWMRICPRKQFTTLDTHDGIGVVDVVGLLDDAQIDAVSDRVNARIADLRQYVQAPPGMVKRGTEKSRQYQLMTSFHSALEENVAAHLLARITQLFVPGIPQVYYQGALFGENDVEAIKASGEPRSVNRHDYTIAEVNEKVQKPEVQRLLEVLRFRKECGAFDGDVSIEQGASPATVTITWATTVESVTLAADFSALSYVVTHAVEGGAETVIFDSTL